MPDWEILCVVSENSVRFSPSITAALDRVGFERLFVDSGSSLAALLPNDCTVVMLGSAFEPFALELFAWAKVRGLPVVAIEEVAQLSLNNCELNNYDLPLDLLLVANATEYRLFRQSGWPEESLAVSGLLSWGKFGGQRNCHEIREQLGAASDKRLLVYTTSPLRSRLTIHNRDDRAFRESVLQALAQIVSKGVWEVVVKLHPNENLAEEQNRIWVISPDIKVCGQETDTLDLLAAADAVMNRGNSETILDAVLLGRPAVIIACGVRTMFHELSGVLLVERAADISTALEKIESGILSVPVDIKEVFDPPPQGVADFIADRIRGLAGVQCYLTAERFEWLVKSFLFLGMQDRLPALFHAHKLRTPLIDSIASAVNCHLAADFTAAARYWQVCSESAPDWFYPRYELAHASLALGAWNAALEHARAAIDLHPPFHFLWHEVPMEIVKTTSLRKMGQAADALAEACSFDAKGVSADMPELLLERAAICLDLGRPDDVRELVRQGLETLAAYPLWPGTDSTFYHRAGLLLRDLGEISRAFACFDKALALSPESFWPLYEKGMLFYRDGRLSEATDVFSAIINRPEHLTFCQQQEVYFKAKDSLWRQGRYLRYSVLLCRSAILRLSHKLTSFVRSYAC